MSTTPVIATPAGIRGSVRYLPDVESLRGFAILLVVVHHMDGWLSPEIHRTHAVVSPMWALVSGGQSGVTLFFVLSAFCLSLPFFRNDGAREPLSLQGFYARRALRILPLYWVVVLVGAVLAANHAADVLRALPWAFFLQSLPGWAEAIPPYTNVLWSLATEVQFYLLLPLLPLAMTSRHWRRAALLALAGYALWYVSFATGILAGNAPTTSEGFRMLLARDWHLSHSLAGRAPVFLAGIGATWLYARHGERLSASALRVPVLSRGGSDVLLLVTMTALAFLLRWQVATGYWIAEGRSLVAWHIVEGLLWSAVLLIVLVLPLRGRTLLCNAPMRKLGLWSYSIYLLHLPVMVWSFHWIGRGFGIDLRSWNPASTAACLAVGAATVGASALTYRWIEMPFLRRKQKIGN